MYKVDKETRKANKKLVKKYLWLLPRNRWTGKVVDDYNYEYTELDDMPIGWRIAFGDNFVRDLDVAYKKLPRKARKYFRIMQIKEKWGELRVYLSGYNDDIDEVISKYTKLSRTTCISTGEPTKYALKGWITPLSSAKLIEKYGQGKFKDEPIYDPSKQTVEEYMEELIKAGFIFDVTKEYDEEEDDE